MMTLRISQQDMMSNVIKDLTYPHRTIISFQMRWSKPDPTINIRTKGHGFKSWKRDVWGVIVGQQCPS